MESRRRTKLLATAACALAAAVLAGCGGGERQDADEPRGSFEVDVVDASFPSRQQVAGRSTLRLRVKNSGSKTVPNVAMTVKTQPRQPGGAPRAFGQDIDDARLADNERPVWIVDRGPDNGDTSYTNTWALGQLRPGQTKTFAWRLTAVEPGAYTVDYEASPGLDGKAKLASGSDAKGSFRVRIDGTPVDARVGENGQVIREGRGSAGETANGGSDR